MKMKLHYFSFLKKVGNFNKLTKLLCVMFKKETTLLLVTTSNLLSCALNGSLQPSTAGYLLVLHLSKEF